MTQAADEQLTADTAVESASPLVIRPYRESDREAVRSILCETAFEGIGQERIFSGRDLFADYWSRYYTDHESELIMVAETEGRVVGYLLGCLDSRRHVRVMATRIVPLILARLAYGWARGRYNGEQDRRFLRWLLRKSWRESPRISMDRYPAHFHCNLLPEAQGHRLYTEMVLRFLETIEKKGIRGLQGGVTERRRGRLSWLWRGYLAHRPDCPATMKEVPTDFGRDVLGSPRVLVNRAYGLYTDEFKGFLKWIRERHRM